MELTYGTEKIEAYLSKIIDDFKIKEEEKDLLKKYIVENGFAFLMQPLSPREQSVFVKRADEKTLKQIGKEWNVTLERVRQIEHKVRRKITLRLIALLDNIKEDEKRNQDIGEEIKKIEVELKRLANKIQDLKDLWMSSEAFEKQQTSSVVLAYETSESIANIPVDNVNLDTEIDKIGLSVRAYNCIYRYMWNKGCVGKVITLRDLSQLTQSELIGIRNLGRKSFEEIINILYHYGIELKDN